MVPDLHVKFMAKAAPFFRLVALLAVVIGHAACSPTASRAPAAKKTIVTTYAVLGAVVKDLAGDQVEVRTAIPNGSDPHEWEPSAKEIELFTKADLIVENGLGLEGGMQKALGQARQAGVRIFTATDHIAVRRVGQGEGVPSGDSDQAAGARDPHFWTDPLAVKAAARALAAEIKADWGIDLSGQLLDLEKRLDALDAEIRKTVEAIPSENRKLVTGHESLGYFAQRYGFRLVGAVVPSLSSEAESSAAELAALKGIIAQNGVRVLFVELGTSQRVVDALARESGAKSVPLATHSVPADGSYFTFMRDLARTIAGNLQ